MDGFDFDVKRIETGNALIGQSGGPTAAINATLSGVIKGLRRSDNVKKIYGARNGIDGVIGKTLVDLGDRIRSDEDYYLLECTPAAALGSCRHKLPLLDDTKFYEGVFEVFSEYDIRYFFYIGGNDSMDTVDKLSKYAEKTGYPIHIIGVPKTIDNDLEGTDHTPGFGSAAKYVAATVEEIARDCSVYTVKAVTIVEIMGRDAGWLTAAAGLPGLCGQACPDLIYLPEAVFDYEEFITSVETLLKHKPNIVIAVSEGIRDADGKYIGEGSQSGAVDIFGHKYLAGAARVLEAYIREKIGCKVRAVELSLPQRCAGHCLSKTDIEESVLIGAQAAVFALEGKTGCFAVFKRLDGEDYSVEIGCVPVCEVANKIKKVDRRLINEAGNNVTDELLRIILPLVQGRVDYPEVNGLPEHFVI